MFSLTYQVFALQHRIVPRLTEQDIIKQDEIYGQKRNEKS